MEANAGGRGGGRRPGATNYKPNILMDIIAERKPVSNDDWVAVANYYQELSEEATVRESTGVKRYFYEVLCKKNKKVTGTSTLAERTRRPRASIVIFLPK